MSFNPFGDDIEHPTKTCHEEGCPAGFRDTGRWAPERRSGSGWFHQRNGWSYCPDHTPDWVAEWREKKAAR